MCADYLLSYTQVEAIYIPESRAAFTRRACATLSTKKIIISSLIIGKKYMFFFCVQISVLIYRVYVSYGACIYIFVLDRERNDNDNKSSARKMELISYNHVYIYICIPVRVLRVCVYYNEELLFFRTQ